MVGLLYFFDGHTSYATANKGYLGEQNLTATDYPGGPCTNLMSCMVSYSFAGFGGGGGAGLGPWLQQPEFPEEVSELSDNESGRVLFEVLFMIITSSFMISIITGIISDTFGELRTEQDEAMLYRSTTCFVTGISIPDVLDPKSTDYMQYTYLILYLERMAYHECTPLERQIKRQIDRGRGDR